MLLIVCLLISFFMVGMYSFMFLVFISGVSRKHNMALFLSSRPWIAAFQLLSSSHLLFCSLSFSLSSPSSPISQLPLCCHLCNIMSYICETLYCSRLKYNLNVADRLADEHVLIGLYVNLLQNNPKTWLVGVMLCLTNTIEKIIIMPSHGLSSNLKFFWVSYSPNIACYQTV